MLTILTAVIGHFLTIKQSADLLHQILQVVKRLKTFSILKLSLARRRRILFQTRETITGGKNSIFNELPYWRDLLLRHNLDVMHIEKNVCELLLGTLLNTKLKSKDTLAVQHALAKSNLHPELHPIPRGNGRWVIPPAKYTMSGNEKLKFLRVIKNIKVPDGYSSNISKCVNIKEKKMTGLKSHDCHVIMQQLLPIAIRVLPDNDIVAVVTELCHYFRELCSKEYTSNDF